MAELFKFWNHGVQVTPEYCKAFTNTDNGLYMRRAGWGTKVKQDAKTTNWFHLPLTGASKLDGDGTFANCVFLNAQINSGAIITRIHVTLIDQSKNTPNPKMLFSKSVSLTDTKDIFTFPFPNTMSSGALVLSVHVEFKDRVGELIFRSAGVNIFEK